MFGFGGVKKCDHTENIDRINGRMITNVGELEFELFAKECPKTVWNFVNLAEGRQETPVKEGNFYEGIIFHRVISGFMIQAGCPLMTGRGNPGYKFEDEFHPELRHSTEGTFSMANSGPNSNGSQFFITLAPTPSLDNRHAVFGRITKGMDIIHEIGQVRTNEDDRPLEDIVIQKIEFTR